MISKYGFHSLLFFTQKVDLEFNVDTLRITDLGEDAQQGYNAPQPPLKDVKPTMASDGKVESGTQQETAKVRADIQSSKLKSLLNQIKTQ